MSEFQVLEPHPRTDSTLSRVSALFSRRDLPSDVLRDASRRLRILAACWVGVSAVVATVINVVLPAFGYELPPDAPWPVPALPIMGMLTVVWLVVIAYLRRERPPRVVLNLSLAMEVALAAGIAGIAVAGGGTSLVPGRLSVACIVILLHPSIVPDTPLRTLGAGVAAASMEPVGFALARWFGLPTVPAAQVFVASYFSYICAVLALIPAHVIGTLGRRVGEARELGSYRLVERLGVGGMGEVWRARHRILARPAAVKLIKPEMLRSAGDGTAEMLRERFFREAEATAALQSPHTVALYDFGAAADGTFYYAMELLDGLDLETVVARHGPFPPERAVHLLEQVCRSLAEAHARNLVHRDIKPANIYVCRVGIEYDFAKVLDFGLVKTAASTDDHQTMLQTAPDITTGTPAYMAPEMILKTGPIDGRADLYCLGCVAYYLLTGRRVFERAGAMQVLLAHVNDRPVPVSEAAHGPVPPLLERAVMSCLAKDPADRPPDALTLLNMLRATNLTGAWTADRARAWWDAHAPRSGAAPDAALSTH